MLDPFSGSHLLILLAAALVVVGPKDLPKLMRMAGKWVGKGRSMMAALKQGFDEMARQSELDALRQEVEALHSHAVDAGPEAAAPAADRAAAEP